MDPVRNPFAPGAGSQPPALAGRAAVLQDAETVLLRTLQGRHGRSQMLLGLRGVGKTVLLNKIENLGDQAINCPNPERFEDDNGDFHARFFCDVLIVVMDNLCQRTVCL